MANALMKESKQVAYYNGFLVQVADALENERRYPVPYKKAVYFEKGTGRPMRPVDAKTPHFRYLPGEADRSQPVGSTGESLAHAKAKEILLRRSEIRFTSYRRDYAFGFKGALRKEEPFSAPISKKNLRIDVVAELESAGYPIEGANTLAMEIRIGHEVEEDKKAELRTGRYPTIELTLPSDLTRYTDANSDQAGYAELMRRLEGLLLRPVLTHVEWIYPSEFEIRQRELEQARTTPAPETIIAHIEPSAQPVCTSPLPPPVATPEITPVEASKAVALPVVENRPYISMPSPQGSATRRWWTRLWSYLFGDEQS